MARGPLHGTDQRPAITPIPDVSALLLAGGQSRRMGKMKALLAVRDRPIIEEEAQILRALFPEVHLSTNEPDAFAFLGLPVVPDRFPGCGPLAGIHAGLLRSSRPRMLAVACDMPFLREPLLRFLATLARDADVVVPRIGGELEPLLAVYSRSCLGPIETQLLAGVFKITRFYAKVRVREISQSELATVDPGARSFFNVNTPEELEKARRLAGGRR